MSQQTNRCRQCGALLKNKTPRAKYCDTKCKSAYFREKRLKESGREPGYQPKQCTICGSWFKPNSGIAKVCHDEECTKEYRRRRFRQWRMLRKGVDLDEMKRQEQERETRQLLNQFLTRKVNRHDDTASQEEESVRAA